MMSVFIMLALLVNFIAVSQGLAALNLSDGVVGVYEDLKWKALLCCDHPVQTVNGGLSEHPPEQQCQLLNATKQQSFGSCLDILCWLEGERENLICNAKTRRASASAAAAASTLFSVSPHQLVVRLNVLSDETNSTTQCVGEDTTICSISLHGRDATVSLVISISENGSTALSPKMQVSIYQLQRPGPPVNLHYNVTTEGEVIFRWTGTQPDNNTISYEIRYLSNSLLQEWKVLKVKGRSWVALNELSFEIRDTVQVRCQNYFGYWSEWSQPFYFRQEVSYIPAEVFTTPGSEVTVYSVFHNRSWSASKAVWFLNGKIKIPESQYRVINEQVSTVTLKMDKAGFDTLMCCFTLGEKSMCSIAYAKIYTEGRFDANITCQSKYSYVDTMSCTWNQSNWAQVRLLYRQYRSKCIEEAEEDASLVKECPSGAGDHRKCNLSQISMIFCYKFWLEVEGGRGQSFPAYVMPIDYVKPSPPFDLKAITLPNKTLSVKWKRPSLPVYGMQYELQFKALTGMANTQWKVIGSLLEPQAEIQLEESCVQFEVEVRCKDVNNTGYWSDWSSSHISTVFNLKAPEMGPDFWRILQEDPARNVTKVTLIFKQPILAEDPNSCVEGLVIKHQASGGVMWSNETTLAQFHSFQWRKEAHTVTVMSRNALGISTWNRNITLLRQAKRRCVRSFSAVANASCVYLSWSLLSDQPAPQSFVIEWLDLNKDPEKDVSLTERIQWVRVESRSRDLSLCRRFYGSEEFTLYPVFVDGEGEPVRYTATRGDPAAYILLLIIAFLSVVLFVTLMMSQNQMKKLMWKDVPNPNKCSWAKGMDFRQIDTMESLFPHSEGLTACPLLLVSESICEVEIIEKPHPLTIEHLKDNEVLPSGDKTTTDSFLQGDSSEALEASTATPTPETSGQSSVTYSTILLSDQPSQLQKQQESLSSSSDEGNFSANNSDISGSFPGGLWDLENSNPRHSSSYNSVEEFSETSEQDYEALENTGVAKDLYYLEMTEEEKEEEEEDEPEEGQNKNPRPLLESQNSTACNSSSMSHSIPLYLPQFRSECINPP
ncbi:leptin receptor [Danio aesculapii]|uniref:leptin receptor n=1 Tax=Danio aesculapii TaxID=1142201 RepID=UPI0024BF6129|nr:leptin receptor [Danio aesculapii]